MKAQEFINEAFDQPYKILRWEKGDHGDVDAIARLDDNTFLSIMFTKGFSQETKEEAWSVEFYRNNSQEVTGEGDAQRVFATVLSAIQTFIKKYKPNKVYFSASKQVEPGQKEQSRARLYDSLVQRYARAWGFRAFRADTGNKVMYELSRIKPVAEEINSDVFNPAFNDTQIFDELTYRATAEKGYNDKTYFQVKVFNSNFQQVGLAKFSPTKRGLVSAMTWVHPEYQGQGLARNIYAYVRSLGNTIAPSRNQLPAGKAMWASWKKSGDAKYLMNDVAEGQDDKAEAYRAHLIKTLPQIMKLFANIGKGWIPSKEQMLSAVDTAYIVMKHTGDVKQAGKVLMDELNTLYRMSQGKQGVAENFADGKKPGRKGLAKRMGVDCKQSVSKLRGIAANSSGERQRMAHWCANMKSGGKK